MHMTSRLIFHLCQKFDQPAVMLATLNSALLIEFLSKLILPCCADQYIYKNKTEKLFSVKAA